MDSMQRFLAKLRELIRGKVKSANLTSDEFDECVRQARSHVGGTMRWEKARENAGEGSQMNEWKLLGELSLAEDKKSARIQIFPKVHKYDHPRYGELNVSPDFLKEVKANFDAHVYQQDLPLTIDLEHESKLSGAAGWIKDVEVSGEQGMFATIEFNDRGQSLVADGGFKYFSPEFYDTWVDPATGRQYSNVLIGGALTNRPFFKGMAPVAMMREGALLFVESAEDMGDDMEAMMRAMQSMMAMMGKGMMPDKEMMVEMEGMMGKMKKAIPKGQTEKKTPSIPNPNTDFGVHLGTEKSMQHAEKTEDGNVYTKGDYLYAPTDQPSDWKLRIAEYVDGAKKVTKAQLGRAAAALGKGFRGNKVELPDGMHAKMVAKLKGMYSQMGVKPDDMPAMMASLVEAGLSEEDASASLVELGLGESTGGDAMGMTEDEVRQLGEMQASVKSLGERLATEAEARKAAEIRTTAAEEEAKKARESVAAMERQDKLRSFREFVREHRQGFQCEVEEATERLMRFSTSMAAEDFTAYLDERKAHHEQMKTSALLGEVGHAGTAPKGVAAEFDAAIAKAMQEGSLDKAAATDKVASENPGLYKRYDDAFKKAIKRGGE